MPLIVERRSELLRRKRFLRVTRIVTERTAILVVTHCARKGVVHSKVGLVEVALTIADRFMPS